jgi:hypothetical protein
MTALRISAKFQTIELLLVAGVTLAWAIGAAIVGVTLTGYVRSFPSCFGLTEVAGPECAGASLAFGGWDQTAELFLWAVLAFPVVLGSVLGAPIVSRELEAGTAQLSWSINPSRGSWLRFRLAPVLLIGAGALSIAAIGGELLQIVRLAGDEPGFLRFDQRGVPVLARGLAAFSVSLFVGTVVGRSLPAVLIAMIVSTTILLGSVTALDAWRRTESQVVDVTSSDAQSVLRGALILESVVILPDGTVTTEMSQVWPDGTRFSAVRAISGDQYWLWVTRELGILLVVTLAAWVGLLTVLRNRRPL